ncbi:MAG: cupin domain-containing protein [Nanoarchaeota archaeon]|nr:cupin domain-containing protein [Nanoarchaeota archaeon]
MNTKDIIIPPASKNLKSRRVFLDAGEEVGEHSTKEREELIIIIDGEATLINIDEGNKEKMKKETILKAGDAFFIGQKKTHNVINKSDKKLEYIYVTG